jgi:ABC-type uncharacterized transport system YnjBCD substrate-binding protein
MSKLETILFHCKAKKGETKPIYTMLAKHKDNTLYITVASPNKHFDSYTKKIGRTLVTDRMQNHSVESVTITNNDITKFPINVKKSFNHYASVALRYFKLDKEMTVDITEHDFESWDSPCDLCEYLETKI